jgi:Subtilase family
MRSRTRTRALVAALALSCAVAPSAPAAWAAGPALSPSAYSVSRVCPRPAPAHAGCLGLRLVARAPLSVPHARALGAPARGSVGSPATEFTVPVPRSLAPGELVSAYSLPAAPAGSGQTIAIVDAYDDASIESDLERYDQQFALSACSEHNGCFRKVNEEGKSAPLPASGGSPEREWAQEIATDVELAHGICQGCRILLVEAQSNSDGDLFAAEATAARLGASEISNSWGGEEPATDSPAFNQPGIVVTAASGDSGYLGWLEEPPVPYADYPASSPHVVAVGGTRLSLTQPGGGWAGETVWNDGGKSEGFSVGEGATGGGCSGVFTAPAWQQGLSGWSALGCGARRAVADVSADADPYSGVAVYNSTTNSIGDRGWGVMGGTSVASPIIAAAFALAGGAHGVSYPAQTLYESALGAPSSLHDILSGSNGECTQPINETTQTAGCSSAQESASCAGTAICLAGPGYDGPSGVGTPNGIGAFQPTPPGGGGPSTTPGGPASGVGGGVTTTAQAGGEGQAGASAGGASPGAGVAGASGSPPARQAALEPVVSGLRLTARAVAALRGARPHVSQVGFAFALSTGTSLRVTLARRVRAGGRLRWKQTAWASLLLATGGQEARHLHGRRALIGGRYQLTLLPAGGRAETISFRIS